MSGRWCYVVIWQTNKTKNKSRTVAIDLMFIHFILPTALFLWPRTFNFAVICHYRIEIQCFFFSSGIKILLLLHFSLSLYCYELFLFLFQDFVFVLTIPMSHSTHFIRWKVKKIRCNHLAQHYFMFEIMRFIFYTIVGHFSAVCNFSTTQKHIKHFSLDSRAISLHCCIHMFSLFFSMTIEKGTFFSALLSEGTFNKINLFENISPVHLIKILFLTLYFLFATQSTSARSNLPTG